MSIRSVNPTVRSSFVMRLLERKYPSSKITPFTLALERGDANITARPSANQRYIESFLQRRFTNLRSDVLMRAQVRRECMLPGIKEGDNVRFEERQYLGGFFDPDYPNRSDIVCFWNPRTEEGMIKRLIALPGDSIEMKDGRIFLNGAILFERYYVIGTLADMARVFIPRRHVFLMADNRDRNEDSRSLGPIHISNIFGIVREVIRAQ